MNYIYHRVPNDFKGDTLYPLNTIRTIYPAVYANEVSKYVGREHVTMQRIPLFGDALWNDVLFLIAVEPHKLYEARRAAGWSDMKPQRFFKIDPRSLDQTKLGIFLFQENADPRNYKQENFKEYSYESLSDITEIPDSTRQYFQTEFEAGEPYIKLFFRYIPHVLYHGNINVTELEIITV